MHEYILSRLPIIIGRARYINARESANFDRSRIGTHTRLRNLPAACMCVRARATSRKTRDIDTTDGPDAQYLLCRAFQREILNYVRIRSIAITLGRRAKYTVGKHARRIISRGETPAQKDTLTETSLGSPATGAPLFSAMRTGERGNI